MFEGIKEGFSDVGKILRDQSVNNLENAQGFSKKGKIAAVVGLVASVALVLFGGPIGFIFGALLGVASYDSFRMFDNIAHADAVPSRQETTKGMILLNLLFDRFVKVDDGQTPDGNPA